MDSDTNQFSQREKEVIESLLQGKSNKQIALALGISPNTVEYHLKKIYKKLQVNSRTEAVLQLGKSVVSHTPSTPRESAVEMNSKNADNGVKSVSTRRISLKKIYAVVGTLLIIISALVLFFVNRPDPSAEGTPTNTAKLPDLAITSAYVSMVDENGNCIDTYVLLVIAANQSAVPVHDVAVSTANHSTQLEILEAYQSKVIFFPATATDGNYTAVIDPENLILETNEDNNSLSTFVSTPTPVADCPPPLIQTLSNNGSATQAPYPLPTATPAAPFILLASPTPLLFTDPSIPISERIVHYYFITPAENPPPDGSIVVISYILAPTPSDRTYGPDTATNIRASLENVLRDERNGWTSTNVAIVDVTFNDGHTNVILQGEYFGVGDVTLIAARMQILMTVFANPSVQTATVTLNGDTIGNMGISNSLEAKPAGYIFTRSEIETFQRDHVYGTP